MQRVRPDRAQLAQQEEVPELGRPLTIRGAIRRLRKHERLLARVRKLLAKPIGPVPPCPHCGSHEGCYSDCFVAPWNMDD